jgi:hypothetical protein
MTLLAIDPGNEYSAAVLLNAAGVPVEFWKEPNEEVRRRIRSISGNLDVEHLAIEMIASYGMPVGAEVFETCLWIGRFVEVWSGHFTLVYRRDVKMCLCGNNSAKDGNVRQALIDRFGGKERAIGKKKKPGPLHGFHDDLWAALGVAVTWTEMHGKRAA